MVTSDCLLLLQLVLSAWRLNNYYGNKTLRKTLQSGKEGVTDRGERQGRERQGMEGKQSMPPAMLTSLLPPSTLRSLPWSLPCVTPATLPPSLRTPRHPASRTPSVNEQVIYRYPVPSAQPSPPFLLPPFCLTQACCVLTITTTIPQTRSSAVNST